MGKRELIYIPIVHTLADMGALGESVKEASFEKIGKTAWKQKMNLIDQLWTKIETCVDLFKLDYEKVHLYQDGLPVCGKEEEIVRELAETGSRNHELLVRLMEKGAQLVGTESPELLEEEYHSYKELLSAESPVSLSRREKMQEEKAKVLLQKRDRFMARRINDDLPAEHVGILFVGMLHSLWHYVDPAIRMTYPIGRPS